MHNKSKEKIVFTISFILPNNWLLVKLHFFPYIDIKIGDEVIIFGEGDATVERIANDLGTINYFAF